MKAYCITLDSTPQRWEKASSHFRESDIDVRRFNGFNAEQLGLLTTHPYEIDHPGSRYLISHKHVGMCLSHIALWKAIETQCSDDWYIILEDDAEFIPNWRSYFDLALTVLPDDWDMLFIGSCNCGGLPKELIGQNLYRVKWPQCTHAYMIRSKSIPVLIATQTKIWAPIDLSLRFLSFDKMNIYTILPRLAGQRDTIIGA